MNRSASPEKWWGQAFSVPSKAHLLARDGSGKKFGLALCILAGISLMVGSIAEARGREKPDSIKRGRRVEIARDHVRDHCDEFGLDLEDVEDSESHEYESRHNSTTHINLHQKIRGIPINGANMGLAVDHRGRVFGRWSDFIPKARNRINRRRPDLTPGEAVEAAATALGLTGLGKLEILTQTPGPAPTVTLGGGQLSRGPIPVKLVYQPVGDELRLAWDIAIRTLDGAHWWNVQIDAKNGEILGRSDWISRETYRVFGPAPTLTPDQGPHVLTGLPALGASPEASPFGWHDTNGIPGPEYTDTRGNNVYAQEDTDANDVGGFRPNGGAGLDFDFPVDLSQSPSTYQSASITSLFYWGNVAHDLFYQYGFDEASGNFQLNTYGRGGSGSDPVLADSQDGAGVDNARFGAPPDGFAGVMEMFLFTPPVQLQILTPVSVAGPYPAGAAEFGPSPPATPMVAEIVAALDAANGLGPSTTDACTSLTNDAEVEDNIVLIDRGSCNFTTKIANAEDAGAIGAIVANNVGDALLIMGGTDPSITIPSLFIGQTSGATIRAELGDVTASIASWPMRDGSLDGGIILHEYGHGVTSRLTGGAANASCLVNAQSEGMGEGWSDFFSLFAGARVGDTSTEPRGMGTYVLGQPESGSGIRSQPYSTDMAINTLTLSAIETAPPPHGIGEVWATALWEVFWQLTSAHGFDADIYEGTGGNNLAMQLVIDALKLQPCNPTFIEARQAIFDAETNHSSGANECLLWRGFAKRGMGFAATVSGDPALLTTTEDFSLPLSCAEFCADGSVNGAEQCDDSNLIDLDGCSQTCRLEESFAFSGIAQGGSVEFVVDGQTVNIVTLAGESAADVASKMATAIGANPVLAGLGAVATASGDQVIVAGSITSTTISDPGLAPPVALPLSDWLPVVIALLLLVSGALRLSHFHRRNHGGPLNP